jgi:hypothetical protein
LPIPGKAGVESQPNQQVKGYRSNLTCLETPPDDHQYRNRASILARETTLAP